MTSIVPYGEEAGGGTPRRWQRAAEAAWLDAAAVTAVWSVMVLVEALVVSFLWIREFSASWEIVRARRLVGTLAIAELAPASLVAVGLMRLVDLAREGRRAARGALAVLGAGSMGALALALSTGRHFASWGARGPFVGALVLAGAAGGALLVPWAATFARRAAWLAPLGIAAVAATWLADVWVLPRLYPAFHLALFVATLLAGALVAAAARGGAGDPTWLGRAGGLAVVAVVAVCAARAPSAARALERFSNIRIILAEHAPILGRAVEVTEALRPAEHWAPWMDAPSVAPGEVRRSLDWSGHDIVLISVDALRADHVSAYGYARATTPNLDALAREGTLFDSAYCPTPHTSYSVTSMMTGKYLRPLLALGLGEDSETWAQDLRRYGWRTAAFYPPAVFFIDEDRFPHFEETRLGFEYAKVEFADPALREEQVARYLDGAPGSSPLFLWVHFFEPHEPYVAHPDHVFAGGRSRRRRRLRRRDRHRRRRHRRIVRLRASAAPGRRGHRHRRPRRGVRRARRALPRHDGLRGAGARAARGRRPGRAPRSARGHRGADHRSPADGALGARHPAAGAAARARPRARCWPASAAGRRRRPRLRRDRRLRARRLRARPARLRAPRGGVRALPARRRPARDARRGAAAQPARFDELRAMLRAVERDHGRYEGGGGPSWPEALRRGMQGDAEAATDVASLLDDADVTIRRKAAEVSFALHAPSTAPELRRALARDEDDEVRRWSALALRARRTSRPPPLADALLKDGAREWRRRAALALGERGDPRACDEIAAWWAAWLPPPGQERADGEPPRLALDLARVQELLAATAQARCRAAVPALLRALDDVRARPYVADALGSPGRRPGPGAAAGSARRRALRHDATPRGARPARPRRSATGPRPSRRREVHVALEGAPGPLRVLVLLSDAGATLDGEADGAALSSPHVDGEVRSVRRGSPRAGPSVRLDLRASRGGIVALWLVPARRRRATRLD